MTYCNPVLWEHQKVSVARAKDLNEFGFLFDPGAGKTLAAITTLRWKYADAKRLLPTLVLSPAITLENWKEEWSKFSKIPEDQVVVLTGPVKKRLLTLKAAVEKYRGAVIAITNYEGITQHKTNQANMDILRYILQEWQPMCLVVDESHRCATVKSSRTKSVIKIADNAIYRYILTGTFVTNSPEDIWAQFRILDLGASFGKNYWGFLGQYFYDANAGNPHRPYKDWKLQKGSMDKLRDIVARKTMRIKKEDCIDLPELVTKTVYVDLTPEQLKHYNEMKAEMLTFINDAACIASMALTKTLRLMQIVSGFMKLEDGTVVHIPNNREHALEELLMDMPKEKVIVWAVFHENYIQIKRVCDKLGIQYREGHGLVSEKDKYKEIEEFRKDPEVRVLIGNPAAVGIGVNIKEAGTSIDFSYNFSFAQQEQKYARNFRGGSVDHHTKVTRIQLQSKGTIEDIIIKALDYKLITSEEILTLVKEQL